MAVLVWADLVHLLGNLEQVWDYYLYKAQTPAYESEWGVPCCLIRPEDNPYILRYGVEAYWALQIALPDWLFDLPKKDVFILVSSAGTYVPEHKVHDIYFPQKTIASRAGAALAREYGFNAGCLSMASTCANDLAALYLAKHLIDDDHAEAVIVGTFAYNANPRSTRALIKSGAISQTKELSRSSCPWDINRDGFVVSNGGSLLIVVKDEIARDLGVTGLEPVEFGFSNDCLANPLVLTKESIKEAIIRCLEAYSVKPDLIKAHGSGTRLNDSLESQALFALFQNKVPVVSYKGVLGHSLGACAGMELALLLKSVQEGYLLPNTNLEYRGLDIADIWLPTTFSRKDIEHALALNYGFGGINCACLLRRVE